MKLTIEGLEKERDFYFGKLRDIEVLAQEYETDGGEFAQKALAVLYATEVNYQHTPFFSNHFPDELMGLRNPKVFA